jgi:hypothetical protein
MPKRDFEYAAAQPMQWFGHIGLAAFGSDGERVGSLHPNLARKRLELPQGALQPGNRPRVVARRLWR